MNKLLFTLAFQTLLISSVTAQTFSGSTGMVNNNGDPSYFTATVSNLPQATLDSVYGIESVTLKIMHPYDAELDVRLFAPDGRSTVLTSGNGGPGDNYFNTTFNDFAVDPIYLGSAPFSGTYRPEQPIGKFNDGMNGEGVWQLYVKDLTPNNANTGYTISWSITFGYNPGPVFHFCSSNLPIVLINTHGQVIPDDPKIPADFNIIDNGNGQRNFVSDTYAYTGRIGIEIRGSSSQMFPKKSYGFETWDYFGGTIDTTLLGMPSESDWILNANYTDKSFCRNVMAYQTWMNMSHYATRYRFVEVVINQEYLGIYILSEKIKRDNNRLDIAKLMPEDTSGNELTGGYVVKIDKSTGSGGDGWISPFPPPVNPNNQYIFFQYDYPASDEIVLQQKNYIEDYITTFESVLEGPHFADTAIGFRKYADELSFIDYFLVNEMSKNVDGYRLSTYLHKEKDSKGGKLRMGPVWDYDIAWHNSDYCGGDQLIGWAYQFPCADDYWQIPFWWNRLLQDPLYASHLKCRWYQLRSNVLSNEYFNSYIDSIAAQLDEAQFRNFVKWPILGIYVWPNPWPYPTTYAGEISNLKTWLSNRLAWLDQYLPGTCTTIGTEELPGAQPEVDIFPNPASEVLTIGYDQSRAGTCRIEVLNEAGIMLLHVDGEKRSAGYYTDQLNITSLAPGIYLLRLTINGNTVHRKIVKI